MRTGLSGPIAAPLNAAVGLGASAAGGLSQAAGRVAGHFQARGTAGQRAVAGAQGRVLEIGFGTGRNLPFYPRNLARVVAVDPNPGMATLARERMESSGVDVEHHQITAERLPFDSASFDCVVSTLTLCSIPDVRNALAEVRRVLRPGGWLYVSEPVYAGALNELVRLYNDEGEVRAAAQAALDRAVASGAWVAAAQRRFEMPVRFASFDDFLAALEQMRGMRELQLRQGALVQSRGLVFEWNALTRANVIRAVMLAEETEDPCPIDSAAETLKPK